MFYVSILVALVYTINTNYGLFSPFTRRTDDYKTGRKSKDGKRPRIGIVGGGASGLSLAYKLNTEYGWSDNIFIYEKESLPSESAQTINVNDELKELGTSSVPRASFDILSIDQVTGHYELDYNNTYKPYQSLINKYGLTLSLDPVSRYSLDINAQTTISLPLPFLFDKGFAINDIIQEIIEVLLYYKDIKLVKFNKNNPEIGLNYNDFIENSLTYDGETLFEWGQRLNLPIMAYFHAYAMDFNGAGPSLYESSAYYALSVGEQFFIPLFQQLLLGLGITKEYFDNPIFDPFLYDIMNDTLILSPSTYIIEEGFQTLWNKSSSQLLENGVNIEYSTKISSIRSTSDKNKVTLIFEDDDIDNKEFDYVFLACRSDDILSALDQNDFIKQYNLFKYKTRYVPYVALTVFNIENKIPQWFIDENLLIGSYSIYPLSGLYLGTAQYDTVYNCSIINVNIYDEEYKAISLMGHTDDLKSNGINKHDHLKYCNNQFIDQLQNDFGITVTNDDIIYSKIQSCATQPTVIGAENGFYQTVQEIQGEDGLFFIGEPVAGYSIPLIMQYIENNYKIFYDKMASKGKK